MGGKGGKKQKEMNPIKLKVGGTQKLTIANAHDNVSKQKEVEKGKCKYSSSNEKVATVAPDKADDRKATITGIGAGTAQINISADADLGQAEKKVTGFVNVEVSDNNILTINKV